MSSRLFIRSENGSSILLIFKRTYQALMDGELFKESEIKKERLSAAHAIDIA